MRVAVVDVGSNTVRLLVAARGGSGLERIREEKAVLLLGEEVERHGRIRGRKLAESPRAWRLRPGRARARRCSTSRSSSPRRGVRARTRDELLHRLAVAAGGRTRVVSAEEEGRLAYLGAVAGAEDELPETVGGLRRRRRLDRDRRRHRWRRAGVVTLGRPRLCATDRALPSRMTRRARRRLRLRGRGGGASLRRDRAADAAGSAGSGRHRACSPQGSSAERSAPRSSRPRARRSAKRSSRELAKAYGVDRSRARTLAAGAVLMAEVQRRLSVPLVVSRIGSP